jgi:hypothetical protein
MHAAALLRSCRSFAPPRASYPSHDLLDPIVDGVALLRQDRIRSVTGFRPTSSTSWMDTEAAASQEPRDPGRANGRAAVGRGSESSDANGASTPDSSTTTSVASSAHTANPSPHSPSRARIRRRGSLAGRAEKYQGGRRGSAPPRLTQPARQLLAKRSPTSCRAFAAPLKCQVPFDSERLSRAFVLLSSFCRACSGTEVSKSFAGRGAASAAFGASARGP